MRKIKPKVENFMINAKKPGKPEPQYPKIRIELDHIPEAKEWKIGEEYEVDMNLKMVGLSISKFQNDAEFEIRDIEPEDEEEEDDDESEESDEESGEPSEEEKKEEGPFKECIEDEEESEEEYKSLAEKYPKHAKIFNEIAADEKRHAELLEKINEEEKSGDEEE